LSEKKKLARLAEKAAEKALKSIEKKQQELAVALAKAI